MQYNVLFQLIFLIGLSGLLKTHQKQQLLEQALNEVFGNSSLETQRKILQSLDFIHTNERFCTARDYISRLRRRCRDHLAW